MPLAVTQRRTGSSVTTSVSAGSWVTPAANKLLPVVVWGNGATPALSGYTGVITSALAAHTSITYGKISAGNESSVTATDGSAAIMEIFAVELAGAVNTSVAAATDKALEFSSGTGSTTASIATGTLAQAAEYLLVGNGWAGAISSPSYGATVGITNQKTAARQLAGDVITAATTGGTVTATWTTSRTRVMSLATFKQSVTAPTVTTSAASSISTTSADGNGNVTSTGDSLVTERGFVWSTSANPTTSDSKVTVAGTTGSYSGSMTSLTANTLYHYRAYAINDAGTSYGADTTFTTLRTGTLSGTITAAVTESDIVAGGKTIILTLVGDTWIAAGALSFDAQRQNIINGLTSAQSEALGWNLVPKALQGVGGVIRTSNTVVTITLDAFPTYDITATETITVTIPGTALTTGLDLIASPTFTVSAIGGVASSSTLMSMGVG